jgi:hypothetical protein
MRYEVSGRFTTQRRFVSSIFAIILSALSFGRPSDAAPARSTAPILHLYVSQPSAHEILRFPLNSAGIPAQIPDAVITGLSEPRGLAVGPDHRLFVVDAAARRLDIYDPSPGNGAVPSHVLNLPFTTGGLGAVGVDSYGYVYIGYNFGCGEGSPCANAAVYSPLPSGNEAPFTTYSLGGSPPVAFVTALVINSEHALAEVVAEQTRININAPNAPNQTPYAVFCPAIITWGGAWGPEKNELYLTNIGSRNSPPGPSQVYVLPNYRNGNVNNCPTSYPITSATVPLDDPFGIAAAGNLIYASSVYNKQLKSALLFVFDSNKAGAQTPLAIVAGPASKLSDPYALAIGP